MSQSSEDVIQLDDDIYRLAVEQSLDGVLITVPDGRILYANPAACAILGRSEEDLRQLGRQGITEPEDPSWQSAVAERRRSGQVKMVGSFIRGDGSRLLADISSAIFASGDGIERSVVILRDVTERILLERRLRAANEITHALLAGEPTTDVLTRIAVHAASLLDTTEAAVITVGSEPGSVVVRAAAGSGMTGLVGRSYRGTLAAQVMESQRSLIVEDLTSSARQEDGRSLGLGPAVVVPIVADGRPFGNLMVGALPGSRLYDAKDLAIVESFAEAAGVVLALGEARSELERRHRETADQLQAALDSRVVIEQAKGVVSASRGVTIEDAFARLRAYARSHNSKLQDVASSVVRRELLP